jgi:peptidoglycan/LPS O-acetylase OafA/YrhL
VFFVISGFLITGLVLRELADGGFSFTRFYIRRALRLLPALYLVLLVTFGVGWFWLDPFELKELSQSIVSTTTFSSNIYFYLKADYFDVSSELKPLLHTWSLGVEEQFYFLYPIILFVLHGLGNRALLCGLIILALASFLFAVIQPTADKSFTFFMLHTRAWELLVGASTCLMLGISKQPDFRTSNILSVIGLALVVVPLAFRSFLSVIPEFLIVLPTIGTAVLLFVCSRPQLLMTRLLSARLLTFLGLLSYSLYLWHQPVLALFRTRWALEPSTVSIIALLFVIFVLSWLTHVFVENPARASIKSLKKTRATLWVIILCSIILLSLGLGGHLTNGFPNRNPELSRLQQNGGLSFQCSGTSIDMPVCKTSDDPDVLLVGDSYAMHLATPLAGVAGTRGIWQMTMSACPPFIKSQPLEGKLSSACLEFNRHLLDALLQKDLRDRVVIFSSSNDLSVKPYRAEVQAGVRAIQARGARIVLVSPTVKSKTTHSCLKNYVRSSVSREECDFPFAESTNSSVFSNLRRFSTELGIDFIDLSNLTCYADNCRVVEDSTVVYRDIGHFSTESEMFVKSFLHNQLISKGYNF